MESPTQHLYEQGDMIKTEIFELKDYSFQKKFILIAGNFSMKILFLIFFWLNPPFSLNNKYLSLSFYSIDFFIQIFIIYRILIVKNLTTLFSKFMKLYYIFSINFHFFILLSLKFDPVSTNLTTKLIILVFSMEIANEILIRYSFDSINLKFFEVTSIILLLGITSIFYNYFFISDENFNEFAKIVYYFHIFIFSFSRMNFSNSNENSIRFNQFLIELLLKFNEFDIKVFRNESFIYEMSYLNNSQNKINSNEFSQNKPQKLKILDYSTALNMNSKKSLFNSKSDSHIPSFKLNIVEKTKNQIKLDNNNQTIDKIVIQRNSLGYVMNETLEKIRNESENKTKITLLKNHDYKNLTGSIKNFVMSEFSQAESRELSIFLKNLFLSKVIDSNTKIGPFQLNLNLENYPEKTEENIIIYVNIFLFEQKVNEYIFISLIERSRDSNYNNKKPRESVSSNQINVSKKGSLITFGFKKSSKNLGRVSVENISFDKKTKNQLKTIISNDGDQVSKNVNIQPFNHDNTLISRNKSQTYTTSLATKDSLHIHKHESEKDNKNDPRIGAILHDFKNILIDYSNSIELIIVNIPMEIQEKVSCHLEQIVFLKSYMMSLIYFMNEFLKKDEFFQNLNPKVIDLSKVIHKIIRLFEIRQLNENRLKEKDQRKKEINFSYETHIFDNSISKRMNNYNQDLIISLFYNIISNSYKSMENGSIKVFLSIENLSSQEYLVVNIKDNGKGIPKKTLENWGKAFNTEEFSTNSSGLGQFIIQTISLNLNLIIPKPESNNQGTLFQIYFPLLKNEEVIRKTYLSTESWNKLTVQLSKLEFYKITPSICDTFTKSNKPINILCIDDSPFIVNSLKENLEKNINLKNSLVNVKKSVNFTEYFQEIHELYSKNGEYFNILIHDFNLGEEFNGFDLAVHVIDFYKKAFKNFNQDEVKVLMLTEEINLYQNYSKKFPFIKEDLIFGKSNLNLISKKIMEFY